MSILIKGMEMPKTCEDCNLESFCSLWFDERRMEKSNKASKRHKDCPLIELPPHGRLIDRDKIAYFKDDSNLVDFDYAYRSQINSMPTIIPAEEGE